MYLINKDMTKEELKKELTNRSIVFAARANKPALEQLLKLHMIEDIKQDISEELKTVEEFDIDTFKVDKYAASYKYRGKRKFLGHYANEQDAEDALLNIGAKGRDITHVTQ